MDRNSDNTRAIVRATTSLPAKRAWIEINVIYLSFFHWPVSLSARRAWIEIITQTKTPIGCVVALRKESVDRNFTSVTSSAGTTGRSPQGERG